MDIMDNSKSLTKSVYSKLLNAMQNQKGVKLSLEEITVLLADWSVREGKIPKNYEGLENQAHFYFFGK